MHYNPDEVSKNIDYASGKHIIKFLRFWYQVTPGIRDFEYFEVLQTKPTATRPKKMKMFLMCLAALTVFALATADYDDNDEYVEGVDSYTIEIFNNFAGNDKLLSKTELKKLLKKFGVTDKKEIEKSVKSEFAKDFNKDGFLNYEEFTADED
ncbi:hypothetical protein HELRODRAFT_183437 [Helobdella robusta]|uniref:Uncharacterized protein n=1 Tax=Helobdella robusta TaxID=6412 RepID=T1FJN3_HELRO|nr:hypothetical protein HELRODRAFT_183437 [Helobdella robusta]ESO11196.1 hypothetical protein HELRODRAFT_183437 [Helobdella robusta]